MILIAGLSPAWQQVLVVERLQPGDLNRAREAYWCGSGKVLNAAVCAHQLIGGQAETVRVLSTLVGPAFEPIASEFASLGIHCTGIRTAAPTRVGTTVVEASNGLATELIENAGPITERELSEFETAFAEAVAYADAVLLIGSLPKGAPTDFFRRLLGHAPCPAVLDVRGPELLAALDACPAVVKPNRQELEQTLGVPIREDKDLQAAANELLRRGAHGVVVTAGGGDVCVVTATESRRLTPPRVERIVNPIGCGDCLAAGITLGLGRGLDLAAAVEVGLGAAARNLQTLLPGDLDGSREQSARR
jgi:tagatose 6-phosphate kinase